MDDNKLESIIFGLKETIAEKDAEIEKLKERCEIAERTKNRLTICDRIALHDKTEKETARKIVDKIKSLTPKCYTIDEIVCWIEERYNIGEANAK